MIDAHAVHAIQEELFGMINAAYDSARLAQEAAHLNLHSNIKTYFADLSAMVKRDSAPLPPMKSTPEKPGESLPLLPGVCNMDPVEPAELIILPEIIADSSPRAAKTSTNDRSPQMRNACTDSSPRSGKAFTNESSISLLPRAPDSSPRMGQACRNSQMSMLNMEYSVATDSDTVEEKQPQTIVLTSVLPVPRESDTKTLMGTKVLRSMRKCAYRDKVVHDWEHLSQALMGSVFSDVSNLHKSWMDAKQVNVTVLLAINSCKVRTVGLPGATEQVNDTTVCTIHPFSKSRTVWDLVGMLLCIHDLAMLPMQVFVLPDSYQAFRDVYDVIAASFWTLDLLVSFFTGVMTPEGLVEMRLQHIARHYIRSWFSIDLIIAAGDWLTLVLNTFRGQVLRVGKASTRTLRALRLFRLPKVGIAINELLGSINSEKMSTVIGVLRLLVLITIVNHYIACLWWWLSQQTEQRSWQDEFLPEPSLGYAYSTALHWALTQFTPASMEVVPVNVYERIFVCTVIIMAMVVFSSFVSSITQAMTHMRSVHARKLAQQSTVRKFFLTHNICRDLARRVKHFIKQHDLLSGRRIKVTDVDTFNLLPRLIQEELREEAFLPILRSHPLFRLSASTCPRAMRQVCTSAVEEISMMPMEELFWHLDVNKMIFVVDGTLQYCHTDSDEPVFVESGEWACEECLWASNPMISGPFVAKAGGCDLITVNPAEFQSIGRAHSSLTGVLVRYGEVFIRHFNLASQSEQELESADLLFNNPVTIDYITEEAASGLKLVKKRKKSGGGVVKLRQSRWDG